MLREERRLRRRLRRLERAQALEHDPLTKVKTAPPSDRRREVGWSLEERMMGLEAHDLLHGKWTLGIDGNLGAHGYDVLGLNRSRISPTFPRYHGVTTEAGL